MNNFVAEIYEQPAALQQSIEKFSIASANLASLDAWAARLQSGELKRVIFTGMGSSFHATWPAMLMLEEHGIYASAIEASELLYYGQLDSHTLVIAVSQSGYSVEVVKLIKSIRQQTASVPVLAVTNDTSSHLALLSDLVLPIYAGAEQTVSTKTYVNTLAVLDLAARVLSGVAMQPALETMHTLVTYIRSALPEWERQAEIISERLTASRFLVFLGRGPSRASAMTAALITKESAKLPTEGMVAGQFRHGPMEVVSSELAVFIFAHAGRTSALNLNLARDLAQIAGQVYVVGTESLIEGTSNILLPDQCALDEWLVPLIEIIPIQLIAAKLAPLRGFDVDRFVHGSKITTLE